MDIMIYLCDIYMTHHLTYTDIYNYTQMNFMSTNNYTQMLTYTDIYNYTQMNFMWIVYIYVYIFCIWILSYYK